MQDNDDFLKSLKQSYYGEALDLLQSALDSLNIGGETNFDEVMRAIHSIKGSAQICGLAQYAALVHELEDRIINSPNKTTEPKKFLTVVKTTLEEFKRYTDALSSNDQLQTKRSLAQLRIQVKSL